ncbi:MAG: ABC transporter permease, partial [Prevotellaceae bacterium]|nr:ABC transporter permease [Prevotellaceae bacterium]
MNKIWLVARREFSVRVRKKSFFVLTLLAPLLMALLVTVPTYIMGLKDDEVKVLAVVDDSRSFDSVLVSSPVLRYDFLQSVSVDSAQKFFKEKDYYALLHIGALGANSEPSEVKFYSTKQVGLEVQQDVLQQLSSEVEQRKLQAYHIAGLSQIVQDTRTKLAAQTVKWDDAGREQKTHVGVAMGISYAAAILTYMFIFMFGSMVMRGVIEEKVNRIVEVIVSSVKPFQLMMGKIVGVALVGLLQFALWIVLTLALISIFGAFLDVSNLSVNALSPNIPAEQMAALPASDLGNVMAYLQGFNFSWIGVCFILFFLGGY